MKDLPTDVQKLQSLLRKAEQERQQLLADNQQLLAEKEELTSTVESQRKALEKAQQALAEVLAKLRGTTRERINPDQLLLFDIGELEELADEAAEPPARRRRKRHGRRRLPPDLPREEVLHELPERERLCPHDGRPMQLIGYETSEQLEYVPAKFLVLVHKRAKYACSTRHDEAKVLTAPKPPQPIEKGLPGPGLLAAAVVGKFGDHLPGYRLEEIFSRQDLLIRRSTIYGWLAAAADLCLPLAQRMIQRVLQSAVVHTDDTAVKLIDKELQGTRSARFWAYVGDRANPYTVYDFTETRQRDGPQKFLAGYRGYLQADAYGGYDGIYLASSGAVVEVACWAHCRRYWWKAREQDPPRAHHVLGVIRRLYDVERGAAGLDDDARQSLRQEHSAPLLAELRTWLDSQRLLPQSLIGKAQTYTRNQWAALQRYLDDGALSIDNNISERSVKPVAIGRKAWLFIGSPVAGRRAAVLLSLLASCKANRVEPWAYLRDVFTELPRGIALDSLLPDQWLAAHPGHRWEIADLRADERVAKGDL